MNKYFVSFWIFVSVLLIPVIARAQAVLPKATSIAVGGVPVLNVTNGTDITTALQNAINSPITENGHSVVLVNIPAGFYFCSSSINLLGTLPIEINGAGKTLTTITWSTDLGSGKYAIDSAEPLDGFQETLSNLSIQGPNHNSGVGTLPALMSGVHCLDKVDVKDCVIQGFYAGAVVDGDHQTFQNDVLGNDYYGAYFIKSTDNTYFDQSWYECDFTGCRFAGVACDNYSSIGGDTFLRCHTGFEPYCFYREPGVDIATGSNGDWLDGDQFMQCEFEGCGNADFWDASFLSSIGNCHFTECGGYGTRYGFNITGLPTTPSLYCGGFSDNTIDIQGPNPGDMEVTNVSGNEWFMPNVTHLINIGQILAPVQSALNANGCGGNLIVDGNTYLTLEWSAASQLQYAPIEFGGQPNYCEVATGNYPILGVVQQAQTGAGLVYVETKGTTELNCPSNAAISSKQPIYIFPNGGSPVIGSAGSGTGTGVLIGQATTNASSSLVSTLLILGI